MSNVAPRPASGLRLSVTMGEPEGFPQTPSALKNGDPAQQRIAEEREGGELVYRGHVFLPNAEHAITVYVTSSGARAVIEGRPDLEGTCAALVRAAAKGDAPPHKIVRWRPL